MRVLGWLFVAACQNPSLLTPEPPAAQPISVGHPVDADVTLAKPQRYRIQLAANQVARGVVMQQGVDVLVTTYDADGKKVHDFDSPNGDTGPEPFVIVAPVPGAYDIEVHAWPGPPGYKGPPPGGKVHTNVDDVITRDAYEDAQLDKQIDSARIKGLFRSLRHHEPGAVDAFWKSLAGHSPIIEPYPGDPKSVLATWVTRTSQPYVGLVGGPDLREKPMVRIADTDLFFLSARVPIDSDLQYGFIADPLPPSYHAPFSKDGGGRFGELQPDPNNPSNGENGPFSRSELPAMPRSPYTEVRPGVAKGTLTELHLKSDAMKEDRRVGIYLPPGFDPKQTYPLVIAFDGEVYGLPGQPPLVPLPTILDNMLADGKLPPVVAAIVANQGTRERDLPGSPAFADFLAGELIPRVRADYHAGLTPAQTLVTGSSFGGLASSFAALHHSDVIGLVLSNSGSYQYRLGAIDHDVAEWSEDNMLLHDYVVSPKLPIRFYMDCGTFEEALRDHNRHLRDVLLAKGYDVTYREFSGSHDYNNWKRTISDGLIALLGSHRE